jgi:hypothetical protein
MSCMFSTCSPRAKRPIQAGLLPVAEEICYGPTCHHREAVLGCNIGIYMCIRNAMKASVGIIVRSSDDARATSISCSYTERVSAVVVFRPYPTVVYPANLPYFSHRPPIEEPFPIKQQDDDARLSIPRCANLKLDSCITDAYTLGSGSVLGAVLTHTH